MGESVCEARGAGAVSDGAGIADASLSVRALAGALTDQLVAHGGEARC
jgi:hypothetical protein